MATNNDKKLFFYAAKKGDLSLLKQALEAGVKVDAREVMTVKQLSAHARSMDKLSRALGDPVERRTSSALYLAAQRGHTDVVKTLIDAGADPNAKGGEDNLAPLFETSWRGLSGVTRALLEGGADPDARNKGDLTPLHYSALFECPEVTKVLLSGGANPNLTDAMGRTPLSSALSKSNNEVTQALIDGGADPKARDKHGQTPLHVAAIHNCSVGTRLLIQAGADPEAQDNEGKTPMDLAHEKGHHEVVEVLAEHRAAQLEKSLPQVEEHTLEGAKVDMSRPFEERLAEMNKLGPMTKEREAERLAAYRQERVDKEGPNTNPVVTKSKCPGFGRF